MSRLLILLPAPPAPARQQTNRSFSSPRPIDLAVANSICYEIIRNRWVNWDFVNKHVSFHKGKTNIGYGTQDHFKFSDKAETVDFEAYKAFLEDYTPEKVEKLSGVPAKDIKYLAALFGDPDKKVVSYWCMGMNQHTRGTWINNLVYNCHLLVGKISQPGNGPFSLTGQPSACGTVREVGTLTHKLPKGVVMKEGARKLAAKIWDVPVENIDPKPTYHTVEMFRALDRGDIRFMWIQVTNPMAGASLSYRRYTRPPPTMWPMWSCRPPCGSSAKDFSATPSGAPSTMSRSYPCRVIA
jgi:nitrate reductase NapA